MPRRALRAVKQRATIWHALLWRRSFGILLFAYAIVGLYDLLVSQVLSEDLQDKLPRVADLIPAWPWWAWPLAGLALLLLLTLEGAYHEISRRDAALGVQRNRDEVAADLARLIREAEGLRIWQARSDEETTTDVMDEAVAWVQGAIAFVEQCFESSYDQRLRIDVGLPLEGCITADHVKAPMPLSYQPQVHALVRERVSKIRYKLEAFMSDLQPQTAGSEVP